MAQKENNPAVLCRSIFKDGKEQLSKTYFTKVYGGFIRQLEKSKHTITHKY